MKHIDPSLDISGSAQVLKVLPRVVEIRVTGYLSRFVLRNALERAADLLAENPAVRGILFDVMAMSGHDPGNAALVFRWVSQHGRGLQRSVVLTRSPHVTGLARAIALLTPWLDSHVASRREDALAALEGNTTGRYRRQGAA